MNCSILNFLSSASDIMDRSNYQMPGAFSNQGYPPVAPNHCFGPTRYNLNPCFGPAVPPPQYVNTCFVSASALRRAYPQMGQPRYEPSFKKKQKLLDIRLLRVLVGEQHWTRLLLLLTILTNNTMSGSGDKDRKPFRPPAYERPYGPPDDPRNPQRP
ncbi:unnamed protein product [Leptosia nina]|uniref:Uncharacterized protein n=1 Tax=Leptosia nina TaxID=320188 RepID=A0AAV1J5C0_9NEOP